MKEGTTWIDIMRQYKPDITDKEANYILWEHTCYPFDDKTTVTQIEQYFQSSSQQTPLHD